MKVLPARVVVCLIGVLGCGDGKDVGGLDLIGKTQKSSPAIEKKKRSSDIEGLGDVLAIDLLQDWVFRRARDGWTLTTAEADVTVEKLKQSGLDLVLSGLPLTPGRSPAAALARAVADTEQLVSGSGGHLAMAASYSDAKAIARSGRIAVMLLAEGADAFVDAPSAVAEYKAKGLLAVGLVAGRGNGFADTAVAPREQSGLTKKGRDFLSHLRDAKVAVDLTHASPTAFWDARAAHSGAVIVSHTACRALMDHPRNLTDIQILGLSRFGGLMGLIFNPEFLAPGADASLETVVAHVSHVKSLGAVSSLALGTDFDGIRPPRGLSHVGHLPRLWDALLEQGFTEEEIKAVMGNNGDRFFTELQREYGAVQYTEDDLLRPLAVDCDSIAGESKGIPGSACDGYVRTGGTRLEPSSRQRVRIKDVASVPVQLEIFGEPGARWQVEGQNLAGRILFHRFVQLDRQGSGTMGVPGDRNLTRLFLSPTTASSLKEVVVWGRPGAAL